MLGFSALAELPIADARTAILSAGWSLKIVAAEVFTPGAAEAELHYGE